MKAKELKAKGRRLENYLQQHFKANLDFESHVNKGSGAGLNKGDLRIPSHNIVIEAKNATQVSLIKDWEQAKVQALGDDIPVLAIRNPKKAEFQEILIVTSLEHFTDLLRAESGEIEVSTKMSYEQRSAHDSLKVAMSRYKKVMNI